MVADTSCSMSSMAECTFPVQPAGGNLHPKRLNHLVSTQSESITYFRWLMVPVNHKKSLEK